MLKKKVGMKEVMIDIRAGLSDASLMEKYDLSTKGLQSLYRKLIDKKALTDADLIGRISLELKPPPETVIAVIYPPKDRQEPLEPDPHVIDFSKSEPLEPRFNETVELEDVDPHVVDFSKSQELQPRADKTVADEDLDPHLVHFAEQQIPQAPSIVVVEQHNLDPNMIEIVEQQDVDPQLIEAALRLIREGNHDSQLMVELELSPSRLSDLLDYLVQIGRLTPEDLENRKPKKQKHCEYCGRVLMEDDFCPRCNADPDAIHDLESEAGDAPDYSHLEEEQAAFYPDAVTAEPGKPIPKKRLLGKTVPWKTVLETLDEKHCPWEEAHTPWTYFSTASRCLFNPSHFFASMPLASAEYIAPLWFGILSITFGAAFGATWIRVFKTGISAINPVNFVMDAALPFIASFLLAPCIVAIWTFMDHSFLRLLQGAQNTFLATFKVIAYSMITMLFSAIPIIGPVISLVWALILQVIGLREIHDIDTNKAATAALAGPTIIIIGWLMLSAGPVIGAGTASTANLCNVIEHFVTSVDMIVDSGKEADEARAEINAALRKFDNSLKGLKKSSHDTDRIKRKAERFHSAGIAALMQRNDPKTEPTAVVELEERVLEFRVDLQQECK